MKVFVVNCGSSSLKYQLIDIGSQGNKVLASGLADRIGAPSGELTHKPLDREGRERFSETERFTDHKSAIDRILAVLTDPVHGVISELNEIKAVGHRVLHGGDEYVKSVLIDDDVIAAIEKYKPLGPLHNPVNLIGVLSCMASLPGVPQVAVFDTAFHQTMPPKAYMYAIPYEYYERFGVRKYGFHGTSHRYVSLRAREMMGRPDFRLITCHLGNGASLAAVLNGECQDTSMGLTPLEGLIMGTRSGSIDPAIVKFLHDNADLSVDRIDTLLNRESGVLGVSGVSNDFRDIEAAASDGNERAKLALDMFYYHVTATIGSYIAALGGVDMIAFTAGVGENSSAGRTAILNNLQFLGFELDQELNSQRGREQFISTPESKVKIAVIPTNEELMIAMDTAEIVSRL